MKKTLLALLSIIAVQALLFSAGCNNAVRSGGAAESSAAGGTRHDAADPRERYAAGGGQTFLDTLNRGREIALSASDLPTLEVVPAVSFSSEKIVAGETRFRIQIMALSQIDMARREKVNAESVLKKPVFMASEQSFYKLYVGDFKTKAEADAALPEIKKLGYKEAWVVSVKAP
jgi:hypothetical protein